MTRTATPVSPARWAAAGLSAALLGSFFLPWISFLGSPVAAHALRERLRGPHRLISAFTRDSQVTLDYHLSLLLWALPVLAGLVLVPALLGRHRAWHALPAGLAGVAAFLFIRAEIGTYPLHRLEEGAFVALGSGVGLLGVAAARLVAASIRMKK